MNEPKLNLDRIPVPILSKNIDLAKKLARSQLSSEKAKLVYLNILAVCAVQNYFRIIGIPTNLQDSNFNPLIAAMDDFSALEVIDKGLLECRGVEPNALNCYVSEEVRGDRIGYVVVQIDLESDRANLVGFAANAETGGLNLVELLPIIDLPAHIDKFRRVINLGRWLKNNIFEGDWLSRESFFTPPTQLAYRSYSTLIQRCKLIELKQSNCELILSISLEKKGDFIFDITIEIEPLSRNYLPPNLKMIVLDSEESSVMEAVSKYENKRIKFKFKGEEKDRFSFKLLDGDFCFQENFVL